MVVGGGNAPEARVCKLFATPIILSLNLFNEFFSSVSLDCHDNMSQANTGGRKTVYSGLLLSI